ncbi:MAG: TIR domain-containing protein [Methylococcales bacterium]
MKIPTIFFVSSTLAKVIAKKLATVLCTIGPKQLKCRLWWDVMEPGKYTLQGLFEECRQADFAIIVLTSDDYLADCKKGTITPAPRDNCIFEAGLFMGALGADPERCFLLADKKLKGNLLSDLDGLTYLPLNIPDDFYDALKRAGEYDPDKLTETIPNPLEESLKTASEAILKLVKKRKLYMRLDQDNVLPNVSKRTLVSFEKLKNEQGILKNQEIVLIMSTEPMELEDYSFAAQIIHNMEKGICYEYIFYAHKEKIRRYVQMLFTLATVNTDGTLARQPLENNLDAMNRLRIRFVPYVPGIELCIHNAADKTAQCYLKLPRGSNDQHRSENYTEENDKFAVWCYGETAKNIRTQLLGEREPKKGKDNHIFVSTSTFNLKAAERKEFLDELKKGLEQIFETSSSAMFFGDK